MLTASFHIEPPPWMTAPDTRAVMAALADDGGAVNALFVGGCVRNAVLGRAPGDVDIATILTPADVTARLNAAGLKAVPTGIDHGTVTAVVGKSAFEITTLRRDVETDGRRAVVAFTTDWREDAARRDFTMNTLLADETGAVYDPTGRGIDDLKAGRVVFVGDAPQRIAEDYLRILRFFRFHAVYGRGAPDAVALTACRAAADKIPALSRERITQEFLKILSVDDPADIVSLMFQNNVLHDISALEYDPSTLRALAELQKRYDAMDTVARLAVVCGFQPAHQQTLDRYLILPGRDRKRLDRLLQVVPTLDNLSEKPIKRLIYKEGADISLQAVLLCAARGHGEGTDQAVHLCRTWAPPVLPVNGEHLKQAGIAEGPALGLALTILEEWWIENNFEPDRIDLLENLKNFS